MKTVLKLLKWLVTAFLVIVLLLIIFQKVTDNKLSIGNIYIFQVVSESMLPDYKVGDIIVTKKDTPDNLNIGDDVTYEGEKGDFAKRIITHRIVDRRVEDNTYYYTTKGTSNPIEDPEITYDRIIGKVVYHTILFSFVGRLMTNIIVYYLLFVSVGVSFAYEVISPFFNKKEDKEDE